MPRKLATQVPAVMSRLIQSTLVQSPPTWYAPVLANPPPVTPPRQVGARARPDAAKKYDDLPPQRVDERREGHTRTHHTKQYREPKLRAVPIVYEADRIRRQFFVDFPFEALRPVSLVEGPAIAAPNPVDGASWTKLSQRGAYPTVEDVIAFTSNLHRHQQLSLTDAYAQATSEFVALRATHEMATLAAAAEARHFGATFKRDEWDRVFDLEARALGDSAAYGPQRFTEYSTKYREPKTWYSYVRGWTIQNEFTGAKGYVQKWRLPAAAEVDAPVEGDLVSAIGSNTAATTEAAAPEPKREEEMDDLELMASILGTNPNGKA
ncbi:37S ribosomal protein S25, mitochondrial [Vanrija pseudolonga]|uniref:Small ribosomal subunit protein mS23 n=1 Tax=Vanrija pseudolonga TaxID=143232 RepID=A0AAF0Y476_9TREE|nr:37S ribosomal protein S25, mitochondrial [Vanrija pseudolonga]